MHILILNGSSKGQYSVTLQTINYLERLHPQHTFEVLHVGQRIKALEKDFAPALAAIEKADLMLWFWFGRKFFGTPWAGRISRHFYYCQNPTPNPTLFLKRNYLPTLFDSFWGV